MLPCCRLPAVPAWLLAFLALLLVKRAFRRGSVSSGGWSLLHHEALRREKPMSFPADQSLLMGGTPSLQQGAGATTP